MRLHAYLDMTGTSAAEFAATIGVTPQAVWRWLNGSRTPSPGEMRKVHDATMGAVSPNDWILDTARKAPAA